MTAPAPPGRELAGRIAVVTGGSRGIGAAIVKQLAQAGANVTFTYRSSDERAQALVASLRAAGAQVAAVRADSGDTPALIAAIDAIASEHGRIDIVVNSAGIGIMNPVEAYRVEDFDRMIAINVRAPYFAAQAAARHMRSGGRIVMIGSAIADRTAFAGASVYALTKAALASMVRGLALDLAARGITVNNVQPGPTATDAQPADGPQRAAIEAMMPSGRLVSAEEVAAMVRYLAGSQGASVTGSSFTIDGGLNA